MLERLQSLDLSRLEGFLSNHALALGALAFIGCTLLVLIVAIAVLARARRRGAEMEFAELKGRLSVMAELAAQQSSEQARTLNERIDTLARHLSQTLDTNARGSATT